MAVFENVIVGILIAGTLLALGVSTMPRNSESRPYNSPTVAYQTDAPEAVRMSGDYNDLPNATPIPTASASYRGGKTKRKFKSRKQSKRKK
jgi:hypothetical protein